MHSFVHRIPEAAPPAEESEGKTDAEGEDPGNEEANEEQEAVEPEPEPEATNNEDDEPGMWEETFKTHHDSKPYGEPISFVAEVMYLPNLWEK